MSFTQNIPQIQASDPNISTWVMASAGTGKTKVLIDRIMRLLINGVDPAKILCITFTNTASNEISYRIKHNVENWIKYDSSELKKVLFDLTGKHFSDQNLKKIKNTLNTFEKKIQDMKICTIHAFCQYSLKRFPFEASISPSFRVINEITEAQIRKNIIEEIFNLQECEQALKRLSLHFHESTIYDIIHSTSSTNVVSIIKNFATEEKYKSFLISETNFQCTNQKKILSQVINLVSDINLLQWQPFNTTCGDIEFLSVLKNYYELSVEERAIRWRELIPLFINSSGNKKIRLISQKLTCEAPDLIKLLLNLQDELFNCLKKVEHNNLIEASTAFFCIAQIFSSRFEKYKRDKGFLDYRDLIRYTKHLFTESKDKDWVMYKLDGGVDHILVDESQDTSKEQWEVITALMNDFFSGESSETHKTFFIVGDEKQSIYSFQGACVDTLKKVKKHFESSALSANRPFKNIQLNHCYRSSQLIIDFVERVLNASDCFVNVPKLLSSSADSPSRIEVWPITMLNKKREELFWPLPCASYQIDSASYTLAVQIAQRIKNLLQSRIILPSTKKTIRKKDIAILIQRRTKFAKILVSTLCEEGISVSGLDKVTLHDNLTIMDVVAIAKFVLLPTDDLNCAILLKSPIFSLSEDQLYELRSSNSTKQTLWYKIQHDLFYRTICTDMMQWIEAYNTTEGVFDFFYIILNCMGVRKLLLQDNNKQDGDILDEFLHLIKKFEKETQGNLYQFIQWFENTDVCVTRDNVDKADSVNIMTVHSAKGLEFPVVIISDATSVSISDKFVFVENDKVALCYPPTLTKKIQARKKQNFDADYQEYLRLMYVAFTRCQDYLIICGSTSRNNVSSNCWYNLAKSVLMEDTTALKHCVLENSEKEKQDIMFWESKPFETKDFEDYDTQVQHANDVIFKEYNFAIEKLRRSNVANSFSHYVPQEKSMHYGRIMHKILEHIVGGNTWDNITPLLQHISTGARAQAMHQLHLLTTSNMWKDLMQGKVCSEVNIVSHQNDNCTKIFRLDLLIETENNVTVIDYKTGDRSKCSTEVIFKYNEQMHRYLQCVEKLHPNKTIKGYLLWLHDMSFSDVPFKKGQLSYFD
ncbi:UvrD-helicase domain-containing protein [Candidatus Sneabacter namystus]|uniref:DNA 3'-5' helicase n=1 Tax=Candidatus Sneabacter namystus TaxID=2601646 RepID=A0A5C0UJB1_9RICK|nr:UvrD-helicase domain-containing protein [Candidatus Sneabacter namystus]QEK39691.1 AAA family ATPase [Candidatus Sneabacter namystus]